MVGLRRPHSIPLTCCWGESLLPPQLPKIPAHELAHIHLRKSVYLL
jgi:hypothetical protein